MNNIRVQNQENTSSAHAFPSRYQQPVDGDNYQDFDPRHARNAESHQDTNPYAQQTRDRLGNSQTRSRTTNMSAIASSVGDQQRPMTIVEEPEAYYRQQQTNLNLVKAKTPNLIGNATR